MTYILGINGGSNTWHDASACVIDETGRILAYLEQERLTRQRHAPKDQIPTSAVARVLEIADVDAAQIEAVAVGWDEPRVRARSGTPWEFHSPTEFLRGLGIARTASPPDLVFVPHHRAHAASTFYASPYESAAVVVVDGSGEDESTSIFAAHRDRPMIRLAAWPQVASLGHFYEAISRHLGLGKFGAGKVMGLAAYGHTDAAPAQKWLALLDPTVPNHTSGAGGSGGIVKPDLFSAIGTDTRWVYEDVRDRWAQLLAEHADAPTTSPWELASDPDAVAVAAAAQHTVESVVAGLVAHARTMTGLDPVCLAGGVALNCAANGRLAGEVFVPPIPHDAGVAVGAAWSLLPPTEPRIIQPYTGGLPGDLPHDLPELEDARIDAVDVDTLVQLLLDGQVVGICRGRSEVGPRALCHRSLLASPATAAMRNTMNGLKQREPWRPFGPVSPAGVDHGLWEPAGHLERYMVGAATLTPRGENVLPAVRHIDNTTRPQRLEADHEPLVDAVLTGLDRAGHPPVLVNTSFNGPGEPLVETATEAIRCARRLGVPACVVNDTLVRFPTLSTPLEPSP